ncbi:MAG: DUF192 domain-containing protein [Burkholderiaceae bacterium]|nr:DUF192 domain-containing protein [Burkholderiaceae bacterium]
MNTLQRLRRTILLVTLAAVAPLQARAQLPTDTLTLRFFQITAEVADTPASRTRGLMGRTALPPNHGMLFVFEQSDRQCFWMKNTPLPLSIAFIDDAGKIANLADMQPFSEETHCSSRPVRFALEMSQGWFAQRGIVPGEQVSGVRIQGAR